ncbi:hypothetical protein AB1Y20_018927 [Prymnesium parvum]|uniref:Ion transport domain-containing protein n=2 Tax=Prymnesium parvum TaxID=97485 RepID=A0AB34JT54_PRYPA
MIATPDAPARESARGWLQRVRHELFMILNDPTYSVFAMSLHMSILCLIFGSVGLMMVQSVPEYEDALPWGWMTSATYVIFIVEYLLRLLVHEGSRCEFLVDPMNLIDLVAISPFVVEQVLSFVMALAPEDAQSTTSGSLRLLRVARLFRLVRLLRLAKYSSDLKIVAECLYRSRAALYTLVFMLALSVVIFSSLMFEAEKGEWDEKAQVRVRSDGSTSPFISIPHTCWWAIVTMTTVGYGDSFPVEPHGKMIAAVAMITGLLVIALPITIIGSNYHEAHSEAFAARLKLAQLASHNARLAAQMEEKMAELRSLVQAAQKLFNEEKEPSDPSFDVVKVNMEMQAVAVKSSIDAYCTLLRLPSVRNVLDKSRHV